MSERHSLAGRDTRSGIAKAATGRVFGCEGGGLGARSRRCGISFELGMSATKVLRSDCLYSPFECRASMPTSGSVAPMTVTSVV